MITAYIMEMFPTEVRSSGYGIAYSLPSVIPAFYPYYMLWLGNTMNYDYTPLVILAAGGVFLLRRVLHQQGPEACPPLIALTAASFEAVTSERVPFGVAVLGGPTTLVDIAGLPRAVPTRPSTLPATTATCTRSRDPQSRAEALGTVDVVLVSHDQHPDNLDNAGRELALQAPVLLTTPTSADRLGAPAHGLPTWSTWTSDNGALTVTALPARHGPADGETDAHGFVNCEVTGFLLEAQAVRACTSAVTMHHSSTFERSASASGELDVAVLFAGAASVPAKFQGRPLSLTAARAAAAAEVLAAAHVVVAHQTGWAHFHEGPDETRQAFQQAGILSKLCSAPLGTWCHLPGSAFPRRR